MQQSKTVQLVTPVQLELTKKEERKKTEKKITTSIKW